MPTNPPAENWESEAKKLLSKICCDGQYVQESINFLRTTIEKALEEQRGRLENNLIPPSESIKSSNPTGYNSPEEE